MLRAKFSMPLPYSLIPSLVPSCRLLQVTYHIKVTIKLRGWGGKVLMDIPIEVAPPSGGLDSRDTDKPTVFPVFNKPIMQFPYFSKSPLDGAEAEFDSISQGTSGGTLRSGRSLDRVSCRSSHSNRSRKSGRSERVKKQYPKVTTKYVNAFGICSCCVGSCGIGIHDA